MSTQDASSPDAPQSPDREASPEVPASPDAEELDNAPESPVGELRDLYESNAPDSPSSIGQKSPEVVRSRSNSPEIETPRKKAIIDSDDEEEVEETGASSSKKRALIDSDDDSDQEKSSPKKRLIGSDASDDEEEPEKQQKTSAIFGDDSDDDEPRQRDNSDDEKEREEHLEEEEAPKAVAAESDDDDDIVDRGGGGGGRGGFEWDFDVMLREKKAERKRKTKRGKDSGIDIINDDDGMITHLVERMKAAAKADRNANLERKPAFQKIKLLPDVKSMMNRAGIVEALIENGFMSAISEWLAPLPDKCLPAMDIRITILKLLHNPRFWKLDRSTLKQSGLGKAVMLLYKHPNETKENKLIANKLIGEWARPIFQLDTDYSSMTKEERVVRDFERMPEVKKKKMNINKSREEEEDNSDDESDRRRPKIKETGGLGPTSSGLLKPGDDGYIPRARVPKPSTRDYVVRPKWNVEGECKDRKATGTRRYDQALRDFQERTKRSKASRSVTVSLEGRNLQI